MWVSFWIIPFSILNETPQFINHLLSNLKWNEWTILIICAFVWHNLQANPFVYVGITCELFDCPLLSPCYALCATFPWWFWFTYMFFGTFNPFEIILQLIHGLYINASAKSLLSMWTWKPMVLFVWTAFVHDWWIALIHHSQLDSMILPY
jgi:hypothetical protein